MLHSLSHLLITALSLDCGYSASALRERVHSLSAGYGILLYTGTSGSEGSLGGLVEMGKNVGRLIERALLAGYVPLGPLDAVLAALSAMEREGMTPRHIAHVVGMLAEERLEGQRMSDRVQFVWSPPELDRVDSRDTAVVVQDLFVQARSSVLISSSLGTDRSVLVTVMRGSMNRLGPGGRQRFAPPKCAARSHHHSRRASSTP